MSPTCIKIRDEMVNATAVSGRKITIMATSTRSRKLGSKPVQNRQRGVNPFKGGVPRSLSADLHLNALYTVATLNAGSPNSYVRWCPNDLYDPLYDAGGGQAMFRDQLYALYHWARCRSFRMSARVYSTSSSPVFLALIPKQDATALTYAQAAEQPGARLDAVTSEHPVYLTVSGDVDSFLENRPGTCMSDDMFKQGSGAALDTKASVNVHLYMYFPMSSGSADLVVSYQIDQNAVFSEVIAQSLS